MSRQPKTTTYLTFADSNHPLAMADGKVYEHRAILYKKVGPADQQCHWCSRSLAWAARPGFLRIVADHLDNDQWNNRPENLVCACMGCNAARRLREATHCTAGHPYTREKTYKWLDTVGRQCRACARAREQAERDARPTRAPAPRKPCAEETKRKIGDANRGKPGNCGNRRVTDAQIAEMNRAFAKGVAVSVLADAFGVSNVTVYAYRHKWKGSQHAF